MAKARTSEVQIGGDKALAGVLALLVAEREARLNDKSEPRKTEVVLADAGLDYAEIAAVTGKNYDAVKQAVRRGRQRK
jgi:DNA-directed RNA polymerase specialized sigma24 family protein